MAIYVDEIKYDGEHDMDETVCTIRWCVEDVLDMMAHKGIETNDENLDLILNDRLGKWLTDRSIELGWEVMDDLIDATMWREKYRG